jgi:UDP-N-acetylglucosamine:LPS N-acetylglucosamine transferase
MLAALDQLLSSEAARRQLSENARALAKPDAAANIAAEILFLTDAR